MKGEPFHIKKRHTKGFMVGPLGRAFLYKTLLSNSAGTFDI